MRLKDLFEQAKNKQATDTSLDSIGMPENSTLKQQMLNATQGAESNNDSGMPENSTLKQQMNNAIQGAETDGISINI